MRAIEQHVSGKSNVLSSGFSALAIPWGRVALFATLTLGFFFPGFTPLWLKATRAIEQRDAAQRGVRLVQLQNTLAAALMARSDTAATDRLFAVYSTYNKLANNGP